MTIKEAREDLEVLLLIDKDTKNRIAGAKELLLTIMQAEGIRTLEGDNYTITKAVRVSKDVDESSLRIWAAQNELPIELMYDNVLNKDRAVEYAGEQLKVNGEIVPWMQVSELEYLTSKPKGK